MKPATREAEDSIDVLYGCLKDLPGDPVADLEAEHRAEIEATRQVKALPMRVDKRRPAVVVQSNATSAGAGIAMPVPAAPPSASPTVAETLAAAPGIAPASALSDGLSHSEP